MKLLETFLRQKRFSAKGRTTRRDFWVFIVISLLITYGTLFVMGFLSARMTHTVGVWICIALTITVAIYFNLLSIFVSIRRLHDAGYSGSWLFPFLLYSLCSNLADDLVPALKDNTTLIGLNLLVLLIYAVVMSRPSDVTPNRFD